MSNVGLGDISNMTGGKTSFTKSIVEAAYEGSDKRRFWVPSEGRYVTFRVSARGLKTISKRGIDVVVAEMRARGEKL